jgi:hypothetical protein
LKKAQSSSPFPIGTDGFPIFNSLKQAAGFTGIPVAAFQLAKRNGCAAFKWNRVYLGPFLTWWFTQRDNSMESREDAEDREARARADLIEIERAQKKRELVPMAEALSYINESFGPMRQLLNAVPKRAASRCNPADPLLAQTVLEEVIGQLIPELRATIPRPPASPAPELPL